MGKHTQTIRWQFAKCLSVFDYFVKLALKGLSLLLFITVLEELSLEIRSGCPEELFMLMIWQ